MILISTVLGISSKLHLESICLHHPRDHIKMSCYQYRDYQNEYKAVSSPLIMAYDENPHACKYGLHVVMEPWCQLLGWMSAGTVMTNVRSYMKWELYWSRDDSIPNISLGVKSIYFVMSLWKLSWCFTRIPYLVFLSFTSLCHATLEADIHVALTILKWSCMSIKFNIRSCFGWWLSSRL